MTVFRVLFSDGSQLVRYKADPDNISARLWAEQMARKYKATVYWCRLGREAGRSYHTGPDGVR